MSVIIYTTKIYRKSNNVFEALVKNIDKYIDTNTEYTPIYSLN